MKVHVIGPSGAGKTTLAAELAERFDLPVYPLDPIAFTDSHWNSFAARKGVGGPRNPSATRLGYGRRLFLETPQIWWQVRWYLRRYRTDQDTDRLPSTSAIRHFLKPRMDKVRRYRSNPAVDDVEAMIRAGLSPCGRMTT